MPERISERRVEQQVVDVPARQMAEESQYPGDTVGAVELRKKNFRNVHRQELFSRLR